MKHLTKNNVHLFTEILSGEAKSLSRECLKEALTLFLRELGEGEKEIQKDEKGKPYFVDFPPFHLSLTHSGPFFAVAFAPFPVGIDCEREGAVNEKVARRYFSPEEKEKKFSRVWCAKEAVGKITGLGLSDAMRATVEDGAAVLDGERYSLFYEKEDEFLICVATKE